MLFKRAHHPFRMITRAKSRKLVLGIESTFDESGAAVIDENGKVHGESLMSQTAEHIEAGGVQSNVAVKLHERNLPFVVNQAMTRAGIDFMDLSAIATATRPGMVSCIKAGLAYSKQLVQKHRLPFIPVHHMEAHALTARSIEKIDFPFLTLLASGGHCLLCLCQGLGSYKVLGESLDEPPGAVYDKVARALGLLGSPKFPNMSGGKMIEALAEEGESSKMTFTVPLTGTFNTRTFSCNFSLSGLQTQVFRRIESLRKNGELGDQEMRDVAASFQQTIVQHILNVLHRGIVFCKRKELLPDTFTLVLSGGVASNKYLRRRVTELCSPLGVELVCPPLHLCTDNGIMIAWTGMEYLLNGTGIVEDIDTVEPAHRSPLGEYIGKEIVRERITLEKVNKKKKG